MGFYQTISRKSDEIYIVCGSGDVLIGTGNSKQGPFLSFSRPVQVNEGIKIGDPVDSECDFEVYVFPTTLESLAVLERAIKAVKEKLEAQEVEAQEVVVQ